MPHAYPDIHVPDYLKNIVIVLHNPQFGGNIGAAFRAVKNTALGQVRLVNPPPDFHKSAYNMAHGARDLLYDAPVFSSLHEAVADCGLVLATTRRTGGWRQTVIDCKTASNVILQHAKNNLVAVVFGQEDCGLPNKEIVKCPYIINIHVSPDFPSINLAQAVLIIGYEIFSAAKELPQDSEPPESAPNHQLELLIDSLKKLLLRVDYIRYGDPDYKMIPIRQMFARAGNLKRDINIWLGVANRITRKLNLLENKKSTGNENAQQNSSSYKKK